MARTRWYRLTDGVNAVVWRLPLPRRVLVRLSGWVYRSPPMPTKRVREVLDALAAAGVDAWCMGGWGVDALFGRQSRMHRDLDLVVDRSDGAAALAALRALGFEEWYRNTLAAGDWYGMSPGEGAPDEQAVAMRDAAMRVVELHLLDQARSGLRAVPGHIAGAPARCLSPDSQLRIYDRYREHTGREHPDCASVRRLAEQQRAAPAPARPG